jgi:hypothetical protein
MIESEIESRHPESQHRQEARSLGELFGDLSREISTLVRDEVTLAKTEMTQKAVKVGKSMGMLAVGGVLAYAGLLALLAAAILGLTALGMAAWVAALVVGAVVVAIGGGLVMLGLNAIRKADLTPQETIRTLKEDEEWAKSTIR